MLFRSLFGSVVGRMDLLGFRRDVDSGSVPQSWLPITSDRGTARFFDGCFRRCLASLPSQRSVVETGVQFERRQPATNTADRPTRGGPCQPSEDGLKKSKKRSEIVERWPIADRSSFALGWMTRHFTRSATLTTSPGSWCWWEVLQKPASLRFVDQA